MNYAASLDEILIHQVIEMTTHCKIASHCNILIQ